MNLERQTTARKPLLSETLSSTAHASNWEQHSANKAIRCIYSFVYLSMSRRRAYHLSDRKETSTMIEKSHKLNKITKLAT